MSFPDNRRHAWLTPLVRDGLLILACLLAHALYLLVAYFRHGYFSFPLDDAWIYQVYARNLAESGQWAFIPGVPSTGSTSILWTLLITPAYWIHINPLWWTHLLGFLCLCGTSLGGARFFGEEAPIRSLAVGLALALEWHLVWAAASGMETGLFAAILVWFWVWVRNHNPVCFGHSLRSGLKLGLWGGVLMLARPEGVLAFGLVVLYGLLCSGKFYLRLRWSIFSGLFFAVVLVPFLYLNYNVSGTMWPNTFYAKQTEYAVLWSYPYLSRFAEQGVVGFVGAQILLVPGLLVGIWKRIQKRPDAWISLLPWGWMLLHWGLYAARLPVTYQHGRYAIPTISLIVIYGVRELFDLVRPHARQLLVRLPSVAWMFAVGSLFPLFLGVHGASAYGRDVSFIENEMVATARWVAAHTAPDDMIAAHDIGALGYFAPRPLVDLAGLVSPDVIPLMNDSQKLTEHIVGSGAGYLVVFPGWSSSYKHLTSDARFCLVWSTAQEENYISYWNAGSMTVYAVRPDEDCLSASP
ncbi:MAG: hypothetical protein JXB07_17340 [Anaerolineae bacterium]|nr:hypothetical protein [Anaerolineae bacterium]